jgi:alpha-glucosidase
MRPFILSRAGSAGIQRYAANWLGDNMSRWDHLALSIPMSLGLGLSGHAFVGADIGGFGENCEPELLIRWFQAACLSPFCRNHNDAGGIDQYPWSFGPEVETACKAAIELRYRLMPYLYTAFIAASETGRPMMRPLLSHDPTDPLLRAVDDQYLFGSDLLVAPIVEKGARTKTVVLPKGEWIDWYTGRTASSRKLEVDAPLGQVPIFARAGAIVPMWPEAPASTMGYQPETIELHVFVPSGDGRFTSTLVEDDGSSYAYENGQRLRTTFTVTRDGNLLRISAETVGRPFEGFRRSGWRICLHGATDPLVFEAPAGDLDWSHRIAR